MKKHAYLIMAHNEFHMLERLIRELDDVRNDIYIHIDKKTDYVDENMIRSWAEHSGVFFIKRRKIYWGTYSIVKCEIALLEAATKNNYHYYHLVSGVDYPLKDQDTIHGFLDDKDDEFISFHENGACGDDFLYKVRYYFPLLKIVGKGNFDGPGKKKAFMRELVRRQWKIQKYQEDHNIDRTRKYPDISFYKGDQWFSITHDFAKYIISNKKRIGKMYRMTNGSDEIFIPTLAMNSEFAKRVTGMSLRQIDWNRGMPYEYRLGDLDELKSSDEFFARKISFDKEPSLVNKLAYNLHPEKKGEDHPLISVIVPCYNVESYLEECVRSLTGQSYDNLEILLVNDGSTDNTGRIAKTLADKYDNVSVINRENGGLSAARNSGIEKARGEYLSFVDSDDYVDSDYISKLYKALIEGGAEISVCGFAKEGAESGDTTFDEDLVMSAHEAMRILADIFPKENLLLAVAWNKLYKRELFDDIRYPEGKIHEDEIICHRLIGKADSIALINDPLYHYRIREGSITAGDKRQSLKHLDYMDAVTDRVKYVHSMFYSDLITVMLYAYFEGIKNLMCVYSDETVKKNRLSSYFRKKALPAYIKDFKSLDSRQKKDYLKLIVFPSAYRKNVIRNIKR